MCVRRAIWALSILAILAGCGDSSLLLQIDPAEGVSIRSVVDGTVLSSEETVPIDISYDEGIVNPISLEVRLLDATGWEIDVVTIPIAGPEDLPEAFGLPDMADGKYTLDIALYDADGLISQELVSFFRSDEQFGLKAITTYPAVIVPDGGGLAIADIAVPEGSDPYVRWKFADTVFYEGYLSEGADWVEFRAPSDSGVYPILFELFPTGPAPGTEFTFPSVYSLETQAFVSAKQQVGKNEFSPLDSYYSLFHFRGETIDYSSEGEDRQTVEIGNPALMVDGGVFGYLIEPGTGFMIGDFLLPPSDDSDAVGPFSVSLKGIFTTDGDPGSILTVVSGSEQEIGRDAALTLGTDGAGLLTVQFGDLDTAFTSGQFFDGSLHTLTLSIIPEEEEGCWLALYVDGFEEARIYTEETAPDFSDTGTTTLFASAGVSGIVDEFGVYYRDETGRPGPDAHVYSKAMSEIHGSKLVFADGFDGSAPLLDVTIAGTATVTGGKLLIKAGSSVVLPIGLELSGRYEFGVKLEGEGSIGLWSDETDEELFAIETDGTVRWKDAASVLPSPITSLSISRSDERIELSTSGSPSVEVPVEGSENVDIRFSAISDFEVDWILILKTPILTEAESAAVALSSSDGSLFNGE